ncbi:hypothetical protein NOVOSPHI9U_690003 [Novosphingobium sp. 9U]|nr:hypothetical protein NOVOSPHI9U_690003 [Novosphingobium sp. 9U]
MSRESSFLDYFRWTDACTSAFYT